jgi:uncharacterized protein (DUF427 family)
MTLSSFDRYQIKVSLSHAEFSLLKGYVEHAAEIDHDVAFNYPQLLAAFREITEQIAFAHSEGFLYDE